MISTVTEVSVLRLPSAWFNAAIVILEVLIPSAHSKQGALCFHFVLGLTNYVVGLDFSYLKTVSKLLVLISSLLTFMCLVKYYFK